MEKRGKPKPVMVWIHGGGFMTGSSKSEVYGPDYLITKDIVFVSFNYRLGFLGKFNFDIINNFIHNNYENSKMLAILSSLEWRN